MFFVRSLIGTTVKPLLGRFVKGGVQIPASSESTFQLDNLILKEETIEELIHSTVPKLFVKHASVDSICVDVSRDGIRVKWNNINIVASLDALERSNHQSTSDELGSSLMNSSIASPSTSEASGILPGLAQRIESITNSIQHVIPLITINVEDIFVVTIINSKYNDTEGLTVESLHISGIPTVYDLRFKFLTVTVGRLVLSEFHLKTFQKITAPPPDNTQASPIPPLQVIITESELHLSETLTVYGHGINVDVARRIVKFDKARLSKCEIVDGSITFNRRSITTIPSQTYSLFDCDKIFMYHESVRPSPVAPAENLGLYHRYCYDVADSTIVFKCRSLIFDFSVVDELKKFHKDLSSTQSKSTFAAEINITQDATICYGGKSIMCNNSSINVDTINNSISWCIRSESVGIPSILTGTRVRAVGNMSRVSVDIDTIFVPDVLLAKNWITSLIPPVEPNAPVVELCLHASKCRIARNTWLLPSSDVMVIGVDMFTIGQSVVITVGSLETTHLRSNAIQVHVGDSISIRAALLNVLADPHEIVSLIRRIESFSDNTKKDNDDHGFKLSDHQLIRKYSQKSSTSSTTERRKLKVSITKTFVQFRHSTCGVGHVDLTVDGLKLKQTESRLIVVADHLVVNNKLRGTVPSPVIARYFIFTSIGDKGDFIARFAKLHGGTENITLNIDQTFIDFCAKYSDELSVALESSKTIVEGEPSLISSFKISSIKARITYKPGDVSCVQSQFLRWVPINDAAVKIRQFECFGMTQHDISVAYGMHLLSDKKNFVRLASGISLIKAPAEMLKNLTELILIPISSDTNLSDVEAQSLVSRVQGLSTKTLVSVLSVGASGSRIQPTGIKQGMIQAGETFRRDANTMIAFITEGGGGTVQLLQLPMMMVASPVSTMISGVCNQLDPKRIQR